MGRKKLKRRKEIPVLGKDMINGKIKRDAQTQETLKTLTWMIPRNAEQ